MNAAPTVPATPTPVAPPVTQEQADWADSMFGLLE